MKQTLLYLLTFITFYSQSYLYDDEYAISPLVGIGNAEKYSYKTVGFALTLFGDLDISIGRTRFNLKENDYFNSEYLSESINQIQYEVSYEIINADYSNLALAWFHINQEGRDANIYGGTLMYSKTNYKEQFYALIGISMVFHDKLEDTSSQLLHLGLTYKLAFKPVNFLIQPAISVAYSRGQVSVNYGVTLASSIPFL
jgi:hypothetical protein